MTNRQSANAEWPAQMQAGLRDLALDLDATQQERLLSYLVLLRTWNRAYNLTAVRDPAQMVSRQLLDSLSILPWVNAAPVLDVGTGAGLPGIPLATALPHLSFTLLDTNSKKTRFLQQAVGELGLDNVEVLRCRVEDLDRPGHYSCILSRAFASLADMLAATRTLLAQGGRWLAMKGVYPDTELAAVPGDIRCEVHPLTVPGETAARHLVLGRPAR